MSTTLKYDDRSFESVWLEETKFLSDIRKEQVPHRADSPKTAGLALSGGGIRAAAFSLGVMQGLNKKDNKPLPPKSTLFDEIDYLSTVSGGGYAGASVTWFRWLAKSKPNPKDHAFFLTLNKNNSGSIENLAEPSEKRCENYQCSLANFPTPNMQELSASQDALNFIRSRKNHLTPTFLLNFLSLAAVTFRTTILSLPIYLSLLVVGISFLRLGAEWMISHISNWFLIRDIGALYASAGSVVGCAIDPHTEAPFSCEPVSFLAFLMLIFCILLFAIWNVVFLAASRSGRYSKWHYSFRRKSQRGIGLLVACMLGLMALWVATLLEHFINGSGVKIQGVIAGLLFGNGVGAYSFTSLLGGGKKTSQRRAKLIIIIIAVALLVLNLTAAHKISEYLLVDSRPFWPSSLSFSELAPALIVFAMFIFLIAGLWANLNYVSLNRMYRDRLMEMFMPDLRMLIMQTTDHEALGADVSYLSKMAQRPYHLVNTHAVLASSTKARIRGRTGDNFVLSPKFCGSRATGYVNTSNFGIKKSQDDTGAMTLATATAISGAAFNPRVGPSGADTVIGNPIVFSMLSYYNLRLGCWVGNPRKETELNETKPTFYREGLKGLLNFSFQENARMVELTDGGHFENTGLYELLQRRTDIIFLSDATADGEFNFKDIGFAIERARADIGVDVRFDDGDWDLTHLMPDSQSEEHYDRRYALARRGFAVARIYYPQRNCPSVQKSKPCAFQSDSSPKIGYLFYIKAVMTRRLPADLYGYRGAYEEFPHQPITDQMFDEAQFEAYRELGFSLTCDMSEKFSEKVSQYLKDPEYDRSLEERKIFGVR